MRAYLRLQRINIAGPNGPVFQSLAKRRSGKPWHEAREGLEAAFRDWGRKEHCDVTGKRTWRRMVLQCVQSMAMDGEVFIRKITGAHGGKYGFALQMIDAQRCPIDHNVSKLSNGNFIRFGIEYNPYGKVVAYYFDNSPPDAAVMGYNYSAADRERVPADEIIHAFDTEMIGQRRGLPWTYTGLFRAKQTSAMEDAAVMNARAGAAKMGFIEWAEGHGPLYEDGDDPIEVEIEPLTVHELPQGAKFNKFDTQYPSSEFAPFVKQMNRGFAAGGGVSYHTIAQDLEGVSFSSIRTGTLDEREAYKERQELLIDEVVTPVLEAWMFHALLSGKVYAGNTVLTVGSLDDLMPHRFQARRWDWVDPRSDSIASETEKNNFITSPSKLIRERGGDPDQVWSEVGQDIQAMKAAGIPDDFIKISFGQKLTPQVQGNDNAEP